MGIKQWLYKTFCKVVNKLIDEPAKSNLSEPFVTFFEKVKSGEIKWTVTGERTVNKQDLRYVTDKEIYTFIIDENTSVILFRSSTDYYYSMWQYPEIFNYDERKVLSDYLRWCERNKIKMEKEKAIQTERDKIKMEKEKAIQTERDKISIALGIPIDKSKS